MKVKKMKTFLNKMGLKGCKWSSLNSPGTENPQSHLILGLEEFPFPINSPRGNKNWPPSMKKKKLENIQIKRGLKE